jgi:hypothetical protein
MDALTTSLLVAVAVFLSSLVGLSLHRLVPDGHLSQETRSVILLGTGTLSLLASLVLGLLVSTAKSSYDATETRIQNYAAELILLDETLRDYGDSALPPRRLLRNYTELFIQILWPKTGAAGTLGESRSAGALMERVRETIRALQPVDEGQKWLRNQALEENILLLRQRWLLAEGSGPSVRPAYIGILVFWVVLIFASFGFNAPRNATVMIGFLCCSLAIGSAIFLILELDHPFSGILRIPSGPLETSLAHMLPAGT